MMFGFLKRRVPDSLFLLESAYCDADLRPSLAGTYELIVSPKIALDLRNETGVSDPPLIYGGLTVRIDPLERGVRVVPPVLRDFPRVMSDYRPEGS